MTMERPRAERDETLKAAIAGLPRSGSGRGVGVTTDFLPGAIGMVHEAARARRMTSAAYMRRAALAFAAHDLGLPLSDALERDPRVTRETGFSVRDPEGTKFGHWEIEGLVDEPRDA